jgi:NAD(P)-dependent dehydrogenase (short-subunit alcohol dehydrogenase family)
MLTVGHFYLSRLLLETISRSDEGRIVMVSSSAHSSYPTEDMTFKTLESVNKDRYYLRRYGTFALVVY